MLDLRDLQGLLVRGYGRLPRATYLLIHLASPALGRQLLAALVPMITDAAHDERTSAVNLALTAPAIALLRPEGCPEGFSEQFVAGMAHPTRSRMLGDFDADAPANWVWGGPGTDAVHVLLALFAADEAALDRAFVEIRKWIDACACDLVAALPTDPLSDREHFGFRDGISQPLIAGLPRSAGASDAVRAGEFVLGYLNEYGQRTERPLLPRSADPHGLLPQDADGTGLADLGRNGTYLAFRHLEQDVDAFQGFLDSQAAPSPEQGDRRTLLAAQLVGRWPSGAPLVQAPDADDAALADANGFGYHHEDPLGLKCPVGAHIRRANPRDALSPDPGTARSLAVNRRHRLLRRGRKYSADPGADSHATASYESNPYQSNERGIHFITLNANLGRQYEFVQHSWVNDPSFNGLVDASDPLVGVRHNGGGTFTIPNEPLRRRHLGLPQFVRVRGGAYFFMPGLAAIRYLATDR